MLQIGHSQQSAAHIQIKEEQESRRQRRSQCDGKSRPPVGNNKGYRIEFRAPSLYVPRFQMIRAGTLAWIGRLLRSAATGIYENGGLGIAKGAAYSSLLSFFPVLTTLAALLVQANAD